MSALLWGRYCEGLLEPGRVFHQKELQLPALEELWPWGGGGTLSPSGPCSEPLLSRQPISAAAVRWLVPVVGSRVCWIV